MTNINEVKLTGLVGEELTYSHEVYGEKFYTTHLTSNRISGVTDYVPLLLSERLIPNIFDIAGKRVAITGNFRSYNKHEGERNQLMLNVFVTEIQIVESEEEEQYENLLHVTGFITKQPVYRKTPQGREICDLLIAVNRSYNKSDYIPCICWGRNARFASELEVGCELELFGRIQSREYNKKLSETESEIRRAYEVSVSKIEKLGDM